MSHNDIDEFKHRHIGTTPVQQEEMAQSAGFDSIQQLIDTTLPDNIKLQNGMTLPSALSESEALKKLRHYAD